MGLEARFIPNTHYKTTGINEIFIHELIIGISLLSFCEHLLYRFTVVDLLSTVGGTMGLFTGFSILSGAEILYWIFGTIASLLCYRYTILDIWDYSLPALLQVYYIYWIFGTISSLLCYRYTIMDIRDYILPALLQVSYTRYSGL